MSYNLVAEGDIDFVDLATAAQDLICADVFPITGDGRDAVGIAVMSKRTKIDGARANLHAFLLELETMGATLYDLYTGQPIEGSEDLNATFERIFGD